MVWTCLKPRTSSDDDLGPLVNRRVHELAPSVTYTTVPLQRLRACRGTKRASHSPSVPEGRKIWQANCMVMSSPVVGCQNTAPPATELPETAASYAK